MTKKWTQQEAIALCRHVEDICTSFGAHIGLTGGCLYKSGERKDLDLILYRIRQAPKIDTDGLFEALQKEIGITKLSGFGFCHKAIYEGKLIDFLCPEEASGEYIPEGESLADIPEIL